MITSFSKVPFKSTLAASQPRLPVVTRQILPERARQSWSTKLQRNPNYIFSSLKAILIIRWTYNDASARAAFRRAGCQFRKRRNRKAEQQTSVENSDHHHSGGGQVVDHDAQREGHFAGPQVGSTFPLCHATSKYLPHSYIELDC